MARQLVAAGTEESAGSEGSSDCDDDLDYDGEATEAEEEEQPAILTTFYTMELRRLERISSSRLQKDPSSVVAFWVILCMAMSAFFARWGQLSLPITPILMSKRQECLDPIYLQPAFLRQVALNRGDEGISSCMHVVLNEPHCLAVMMWPGNTSEEEVDCACCHKGVGTIGTTSTKWDLYIPNFNIGRTSVDNEHEELGGTALEDTALTIASLATVIIVCVAAWWLWRWSETPFTLTIMVLTLIFVVWWVYFLARYGRQDVCSVQHIGVKFDIRPGRLLRWLIESAYTFFCLTDTEKGLLIGYVTCLVTTSFVQILIMKIRPALLRYMCRRGVGAVCWWDVRREPDRYGAQCWSYKTMGLFGCCNGRHCFTYSGDVDPEGRPHGHGQWTDESFHGECLSGIWVHGRPARRFQSRETGTGARFAMRPVGYVAHRADCQPGALSAGSCFVARAAKPRYGVVEVECSIAGGFFPFLPAIRTESAQASLDEMVEAMKAEMCCDLSSLYSSHGDSNRAMDVGRDGGGGADARRQQQQRPQQTEMEALVFVHGWQADMATAVQKLALTTILGKMRPHIVPFVFGWSAGGLLSLHTVRNHSKEYGDDLAAFFAALSRHFREVHVLTHSMGAHFWLANFPAVSKCFTPHRRDSHGQAFTPHRHDSHGQEAESGGEGKLHLATVTLLNAAALVEEVADSLPEVLDFADHFTTYNDTGDVANLMDQLVNTLLPRSWATWRPPVEQGYRALNFGRVVSPLWLELQEDPEGQPRSLAQSATLKGPVVDSSLNWKPWARRRMSKTFGSHPLPPAAAPTDAGARDRIWGCIDLVDCSHIEANAAFSRHNYYAVNSLVVEDICELIGLRRRAGDRSHLVVRDGNVYDFLSAPAALMM